jgi:hypothetical protein
MSGNNRNHRIAVGTAFAAAVLAGTATARADDMQISIDGTDLFPIAGNTATATTDPGSIEFAVAIGDGADADASGGQFTTAFVDGDDSIASAGHLGTFDTALVIGNDSSAYAGYGTPGDPFDLSNPLAPFFGNPAFFDTAAAFGNGVHASATSGSDVTDIEPAAAAAALPAADLPVINPDEDPFEDLHGGGPTDWTGAIDSLLDKYDPSLAAGLDAGVDNYQSADADPFSDLAAAIDPNAFIGGVPNPDDPLSVLAITLDYGIVTYDLPALLGPGVDPFVDAFQSSMVALDSTVDSLLGSI